MDPQEAPLPPVDPPATTDPRRFVRDIPLLCMAFQIAPQQAKLLSLLLVTRIVTPVLAYQTCGCNDASVAIHRLRQRVQKQHGIQVYAQYGVGYALTADMRAQALKILVDFATSSDFAFDVA